MNLSSKQKNYIRKNLKRYDEGQIAAKLRVDKSIVKSFINEKWPDRQKIIATQNKKAVNSLFKDWYIALGLGLLICIVYVNSINNAFVSDDISSILKNNQLGRFGYIFEEYGLSFLRPFFLWVIYSLVNTTPWLYRLINIFFHFGSVVFLYYVLKRMVSPSVGLFASIIFAVHPIAIESITWISGGGHAQYTFFLLASLYFYITRESSRWRYIVSVLMFLCGIITSEKASVFPALLIIFEFANKTFKKNWYRSLPYWITDLIWMFFYISRFGTRVKNLQTIHYVQSGVDNPLIQIPIAVTSYIELAIWPQGLTLYHSEMIFSLGSYVLRLLGFLFFLGMLFISYKKHKIIFFWLSLFFISLLPTLTPLRVSWTVAERYVYFGMTGLVTVLALGFERLLKNKDFRPVVLFVFALIVVSLTVRSIVRNNDWRDEDHLWLATAKYSPSSPNNHNNLGDVYARQGDLPKAAEEFKIAIQLKPNYADAYHNLGITYQRMGQFDKAIASYQEAIRLSPILWQSYQNLSMIYFENGDYKTARDYIVRALEIDPNNPVLKQIYDKFNEDAAKLGL